MKRFYQKVSVSPDLRILLDGKPVHTPGRLPLVLPNTALARAMAKKWEAQGDVILPSSMPFTGLANAAIERISPDPGAFAANLSVFAESELLCYRADGPEPLVARQAELWDPVLAWARTRYDVSFTLIAGVMHQPQPSAMIARLSDVMMARSAFELAALSPIVTISGSLVVALAVFEGELEPAVAFDVSHLDELWQAELWGEDDLALGQRASRRTDFLAACTFLNLLRS